MNAFLKGNQESTPERRHKMARSTERSPHNMGMPGMKPFQGLLSVHGIELPSTSRFQNTPKRPICAVEQRVVQKNNQSYTRADDNEPPIKTLKDACIDGNVGSTIPEMPTTNRSSFDETCKIWIHCNYCFEPYIKKRRKSYLLSCKHILCENCCLPATNDARRFHCKMCENNVHRLEIGNGLPERYKILFHPQPWTEEFLLPSIHEFQKYHRMQLISLMQKMEEKLKKAKAKECQVQQLLAEKLSEKRKLEIEFAELSREVRSIAERRKREKQRIKQQGQQNILSLLNDDSSIDDSVSGAPRFYGFRRTRGALRGRSPSKYVTDRNFTSKVTNIFRPFAFNDTTKANFDL